MNIIDKLLDLGQKAQDGKMSLQTFTLFLANITGAKIDRIVIRPYMASFGLYFHKNRSMAVAMKVYSACSYWAIFHCCSVEGNCMCGSDWDYLHFCFFYKYPSDFRKNKDIVISDNEEDVE